MVQQTDAFFQFPLRALNFGKPVDKVTPDEASVRIQEMIRWCVGDVARSLAEADEGEPVDFIDKALDTLNVKGGDNSAYLRSSLPAPGGNAQVRLKTDFVWAASDGNLGWRDFAYLCAIYCGLGVDQYKCLRINHISAMALGYNASSKLPTKSKPLSRFQAGRTIDKLWQRNFFAKASVDFRNVYYSIRLPEEELEKVIVADAVRRAKKQQSSQVERLRADFLAKLKVLE